MEPQNNLSPYSLGITANKGEWSELYLWFKLLIEGKVHSGDGNLQVQEAFYPILKILRNELDRKMEYALAKDMVVVTEDGKEITSVPVARFVELSSVLLSKIKEGAQGDRAFPIPQLDDFLRKIHCYRIKTQALDKADIHLMVHDYHTGMETPLGFSVKSELGGAPTLFNASLATRFRFELVGGTMDDDTMDEINAIDAKGKIIKRMQAIKDKGVGIQYAGLTHRIFEENLVTIDTKLPEILGWMIQDSYCRGDLNIIHALQRIRQQNPFKYYLDEGHDPYGYKVRSFLVAVALGMLPTKVWTGILDATGGYLVVKEDGEVVCFHIYDRNQLEDYLLQNTKFETPSTSRHKSGLIYKGINNGEAVYFIDMALQIRFI